MPNSTIPNRRRRTPRTASPGVGAGRRRPALRGQTRTVCADTGTAPSTREAAGRCSRARAAPQSADDCPRRGPVGAQASGPCRARPRAVSGRALLMRTGGLADWRTGGLADWRTGGLALSQCAQSHRPCQARAVRGAIHVGHALVFKRLSDGGSYGTGGGSVNFNPQRADERGRPPGTRRQSVGSRACPRIDAAGREPVPRRPADSCCTMRPCRSDDACRLSLPRPATGCGLARKG